MLKSKNNQPSRKSLIWWYLYIQLRYPISFGAILCFRGDFPHNIEDNYENEDFYQQLPNLEDKKNLENNG